jgi:hypothetical protein
MKKFYVNFKSFDENKKLFKEDNYGPFYEYDSAFAFIDSEICGFLHNWFNDSICIGTEIKITKFDRFDERYEYEVEYEGNRFNTIYKIIEED